MGGLRSYKPGTPAWVDLETTLGTTTASRFYCGLFGWRVLARHRPLEDYAGYWIFQQDGGDIGGLAPGRQPGWTVYVSVSDIDAAADQVVESGGAILAWPMQVFDAGRLAVFTDPLGARFAVWEAEAHTGSDIVDVPNSFTWSELVCRDIDAAKRFYNTMFGWEATTWPYGEESTYTEFFRPGADHAVAGMLQMNEMWPEDTPAHWMVYFAVADTDATAARADELGGKVSVAPFDLPKVGRVAVLNDAEGAAFSVLQRN
ncbi:MAG: VOC family protein [Acidimicrobiales bacterium]